MDRRQFRKARVAVLREAYGWTYAEDEIPGAAAARRLWGQAPDLLRARMGGFTTDARSRIQVYPLRAAK